jgi:hypothetical protein
MRLSRVVAPVLLTAVLALTACGPGTPTHIETPAPVVTVTPTPTPTPTPAPDPEPAAITCESIVSPETIAGFAADDIQITPPGDFAAKLDDEHNSLEVFFDAGGVLCQTGKGSGAFEIYGYAVLSQQEFSGLQSQFLDEGYIETFGDLGIQYEVPADTEGLPRICYFRPDAFTVCGNDGDRLVEIQDTLGLT